MRIQNLLPLGAIIASSALLACGSDTGSSGPGGSVGGAKNVGGGTSSSTTSANSGGATSAGGGTQVGGTSSSAGGNTAVTGGATGSSQGGANTGGSGTKATGGSTTTATGGKTSSGGTASTGGTSGTRTGGKSGTGGTASTGGKSGTVTQTGGKTGAGGTSSGPTGGTSTGDTGGTSSTGGSSSTGSAPKGYYYTADWNVTNVDWHGCAWTGIDTVSGTTTSITPQDFMAVAQGGPYHVTGKVNKAYEAVALLGFNIGEAIGTDPNQCKYDPNKSTEDGPPSAPMATITASTLGLAINWTAKTKPGLFRVQLQEPDCASNLGHCYCATVADATGPSFIPWGDFKAYSCNYKDIVDTSDPAAIKNAKQHIDAVVNSVPGNGTTDTPFDFTVVGFAPGNSKDDAPGEQTGCGEQTGKLGDVTSPSEDASMARQVVTDSKCKKYVVFNNNWGNPTGSIQTISYTGNSFTVEKSTGTGSGAPASFPSIYVGASGDLGGGTFNTWSDTGLPKKIGSMASAQTTFTYTGKTSGNFNAAYDVWFSKNQPTAGSYDAAISGFLMVWFYKPGGQVPIGSIKRTATNIAGKSWDVWVGTRGNTSRGTDDANRPVVSYVAQSPITSLTFDLLDFMKDAVANGNSDKTAGGTSQAFTNDWYLTDVFAGFEAWTGQDIVGIKETFSIEIK